MSIDNISSYTPSYLSGKSAGKVSFNTTAKNDYITNETYKTLRTNILFCGADIKTIVITSTSENEGKSTISAELSKSLAEADKKVLLIDSDMRKSVLLRDNMKSQSFSGLSEYLSGQVELDEILYNTQQENFDVIFSGHFPPNPVELLANERFNKLLETARGAYSYIIIDSPPIGVVIDAAVIASKCDGAILVMAAGKISRNDAIEVKDQIMKSGCKILGVVLNDIYAKHRKMYKKYYRKYEYSSKTPVKRK